MGEAIEQLRAQVAFFGVHGADQHEAGRMLEADALTLDDVDAHSGAVEQQVDHMVVEQIDLVDIEHAAIGRSQHAGFEVALATLDGLFDVQRADHAVFRRTDREVHEGGGQRTGRQVCLARSRRSRHSSQKRSGDWGRS